MRALVRWISWRLINLGIRLNPEALSLIYNITTDALLERERSRGVEWTLAKRGSRERTS